jgi:hypothetical protein
MVIALIGAPVAVLPVAAAVPVSVVDAELEVLFLSLLPQAASAKVLASRHKTTRANDHGLRRGLADLL